MKDKIAKSALEFYKEYKRLPSLTEDILEVDGSNLGAELNIRRNFGNQELFIEYMLDNKYITYEKIAELIKDTPTRVKNVMTRSVKDADIHLRREIDILLGLDYYKDISTPYHSMCQKCKNNCKQHYYVELSCKKYTT